MRQCTCDVFPLWYFWVIYVMSGYPESLRFQRKMGFKKGFILGHSSASKLKVSLCMWMLVLFISLWWCLFSSLSAQSHQLSHHLYVFLWLQNLVILILKFSFSIGPNVCVCWRNYLCWIFSSCLSSFNSVWLPRKWDLQRKVWCEKTKWNKVLIKSYITFKFATSLLLWRDGPINLFISSCFLWISFSALQSFCLSVLCYCKFYGKQIRRCNLYRFYSCFCGVLLLLLVSPAFHCWFLISL